LSFLGLFIGFLLSFLGFFFCLLSRVFLGFSFYMLVFVVLVIFVILVVFVIFVILIVFVRVSYFVRLFFLILYDIIQTIKQNINFVFYVFQFDIYHC